MLNSKRIQNVYNQLYKQMRKFIWDFATVESLADLEVEVFQTFPDIDKLKQRFVGLHSRIRSTASEYSNLQKAVDKFQSMLDELDEIYTNLESVREVVSI